MPSQWKCLVLWHRPDEMRIGVNRPVLLDRGKQRGRSQCPDILGTAMTYVSWNMSGNNPASSDVRRVASFLLLAVVLLVWRIPARAADAPVRPFLITSASTRAERDMEVEVNVHKALRKDAQLKPLNLSVRMANGVARLSGPVPSQDVKQRVLRIVEGVQGVLKVDGRDLYVSTSARGSQRMAIVVPDDQPTQTSSASPRFPSTGTVPLPRENGQQVTLLAPQVAPRPARVPEAARLTAHPRLASVTDSILAAVERLRRRDERFHSIRTQVQGSTVRIFPSDAPGEDAMLFAQAVRCVPGVQHVLVASGSR